MGFASNGRGPTLLEDTKGKTWSWSLRLGTDGSGRCPEIESGASIINPADIT